MSTFEKTTNQKCGACPLLKNLSQKSVFVSTFLDWYVGKCRYNYICVAFYKKEYNYGEYKRNCL